MARKREATTADRRLLVRAVRTGYYDLKRRRPGDEFYLLREEDFSDAYRHLDDNGEPIRQEQPKDADGNPLKDANGKLVPAPEILPGWMEWVEDRDDRTLAVAPRTIGDTMVKDREEAKSTVSRQVAGVAGDGEEGHELRKEIEADRERAKAGTAATTAETRRATRAKDEDKG